MGLVSQSDVPTGVTVLLVVLAVALWLTLILFLAWRWRAFRRGEGFAVQLRDDYRGGLPEGASRQLQAADSWLRKNPIAPAMAGGIITGLMLAAFFNAWVGIAGGMGAAAVKRFAWGRPPRNVEAKNPTDEPT